VGRGRLYSAVCSGRPGSISPPVIEECRIAGLDTSAIAVMLGKMNKELVDSIRPEIWEHLEKLIAQRRSS
jgi:hypothetical protein